VRQSTDDVSLHFCRDGDRVSIGALELSPYTVPHDAREPLQYVACAGGRRLGVLTDAGHVTPRLIEALGGCDALMLECNHDRRMLAESNYPPSLRQRIGGPYGHLSNQTSAEILAAIDKQRLKTVVGAHLSKQNNTPALALAALYGVLDAAQVNVMVACQEQGLGWVGV
jgi:phosphoribosyl 1,2-cyclic phosphodiesterase